MKGHSITAGMCRAFRDHLGPIPADAKKFCFWFDPANGGWTWTITRADDGRLMVSGWGMGKRTAAEFDCARALRDLCAAQTEAA
jgi:hypothetical protein